MRSLIVPIAVVLIAFLIALSSVSPKMTHHLTVESHDPTRPALQFYLTYLNEDERASQDTFTVVRKTPFEMNVIGANYLVIVTDSSLMNPALRVSFDERTYLIHNSKVIYWEGRSGLNSKNL
jgi:hypothetical protein